MRVDLEDLASGYSHRPTSEAALARAGRAAMSVKLKPDQVAVDVGGGRGTHAAVWANRGALALVIDPSVGMSGAASHHADLCVARAVSQKLPLRGGVARLVYFHLSIHYGDWRAALDEAMRVLEPGGECWIWTMAEKHHRGSFLARWFPSVGDIDTARFPDPAEIVAYLRERGSLVETGKDIEPKVATAGQWRAAVEAGFVSTLQLIPEDELQAGLEEYDKVYPDPEESVEYVLTFDWIRGRK